MPEKIFDIKDRTLAFSYLVIKFVAKLPQGMTNQIIIKQLIRCATSVGANIAEGYAGSSKKDFTNYYNIALKSANETVYWLKLLKEANSSFSSDIDDLILETNEIVKILAKIVINCRK